ncbi:MAG: hypothetical protein ACXWC8_12635 [Limisphaerales bacterium]
MKSCPQLDGLDNAILAELFWIATEKNLGRGQCVYKQGELLDGSLCLLLAGKIRVIIDGVAVADVSPPILLGESAFATISHERGATLQVISDSATLLEFRPSEEMLAGPLSKLFAEVAWDRWLMSTRLQPG